MVAADLALLSFAVLSTIGFQPVRSEGRYARHRQRIANRDDSETLTYATLQAGDSVTSIPVLTSTPTPPPGGPPRRPTTTGNSPPITVLPLDLGHSASSQEGEGGSPSSDSSSSISLPGPDPQPSSSQEESTSLIFNTLQVDTASVTSTATAAPTVKPPGLPVRPGKTTTAGGAGPVILPTIQLGGGGNPTDNTFVSIVSETPYNTLQTLSDSVTSTASLIPTIKPTRPGQSSSTKDDTSTSADLGTDGGSTEAAGSDSPTSTIGLKATASNSDGSSSVSYIDPEQYGAGGSLTTDSNAPSRTANPTRPSVIPNPTSRVGPPPADTYVPRPPAPPIVSESSTDVVADPTSVASDALSYLPPGAGVAGPSSSSKPFPSSKPGRPTKTAVAPVTLTTLDLGHTAPFPDDGGPTPTSSTNFPVITPTGSFANGTSNSTWIDLSTVLPPLTQWSFTMSESLTTDERGSTGTICMPSDALKPTTTYEVVYTSTLTWWGNPEDYTPPYPSLTTPAPCITPKDPLRFTASYCSATRTASGADTSKYATCVTSTVALTYSFAIPGFDGPPTITFVTTDKNPTVVYSTIETPDYGVSQPATRQQDHTSAEPSPDPRVNTPEYQSQAPTGNGNQSPGNGGAGSGGNGNGNGPAGGGPGNGNGNGNGGNPGPTAVNGAAGNGGGNGNNNNNPGLGGAPANNNPGHAPASPTPITVGVQPTAVVVNGNTITDNPSSPTQTLTIGGEAVTINPTAVVVAGQTVTRTPIVTTGGVFIPTPTSTQIQGIPVVVSSSIAIIGGTSFTLGSTPITTTVSGQAVTLGPSGVVVASTTIAVTSSPSATQVVVEGGELITAIGPSVVVIHGTTLTYGPDRPATTTTVDDDTITIGPSGVVVHGTTLGGPNARPSQTQYEIVGGATITQIGPSVVVINNATYTVGPGTGRTTTVIGGETITIGPSGVAAGTHTMTFPFGPSTTTTITPKATGVVATASPTASKDAAVGVRTPGGWMVLGCFAVGLAGWAF